jgi:uncharacterized protein
MSTAAADRVPKVVTVDDRQFWVADGVELSGVAAVGSRGRPYSRGRWERADRMADTGLFTDDTWRPANPEGRLQDQDRDGVSAEVLYGLFGVTATLPDQEFASLILLAYNDWLVEFCSAHPDRYIGLACLPAHDADAAVKEIVRTADLGLRGGVLDVKNGYRPIWHQDWDPVWEVAQDLDYPISFHSGARRTNEATTLGLMAAPQGDSLLSAAIGMSLLQFNGSADYFGIIFGGALDRYPRLKIVLGESGIGWIPSLLERMDWQYANEFTGLGLQLTPSEYWDRQIYATFQSDRVGMQLIDVLGEDHVLYASDYPHPDGTWPDSQQIIDEQMSHLSDAALQKVIYGNAARLYHL